MNGMLALNNVFIREWLNGCLIPLNLCMLFIITYTVWKQTKFTWGWSKYPGAASACALWWIFFADLIRSVLAWAVLRGAETHAHPYSVLYWQMAPSATLTYILAGAIATAATFRCIYCLSPKRMRLCAWLSAAGVTLTFVVVAYLGAFDWLGDIVLSQVHANTNN